MPAAGRQNVPADDSAAKSFTIAFHTSNAIIIKAASSGDLFLGGVMQGGTQSYGVGPAYMAEIIHIWTRGQAVSVLRLRRRISAAKWCV